MGFLPQGASLAETPAARCVLGGRIVSWRSGRCQPKNTVGLMDFGWFEMISDSDLLGCPVKNMFPKSWLDEQDWASSSRRVPKLTYFSCCCGRGPSWLAIRRCHSGLAISGSLAATLLVLLAKVITGSRVYHVQMLANRPIEIYMRRGFDQPNWELNRKVFFQLVVLLVRLLFRCWSKVTRESRTSW